MSTTHIFVFGHNIHGKANPLDSSVTIREPVDIVPALIACSRAVDEAGGVGDERGKYDFEVIWSGWSQTILRNNIDNRHFSLGFDPSDRSSNLHVLSSFPGSYQKILGFDEIEGFLLDDGRVQAYPVSAAVKGTEAEEEVSLTGQNFADVVTFSSGEAYALLKEGDPCILHYKSFGSLVNPAVEPHRRVFLSLPRLPPTKVTSTSTPSGLTLIPGHAHLLIHFVPPTHPALSTLLALGDNRHQSCIPVPSTGWKKHTITAPLIVSELEGVEIYACRAGMGRSAAKIGVGGEECGEWMIWGKGSDGMDRVVIPLLIDRSGGGIAEHIAPQAEEEDGDEIDLDEGLPGDEIKHFELGDGYEILVTADDRLYVRGRNDFGQLGLEASIAVVDGFLLHPFFAQPSNPTYEAKDEKAIEVRGTDATGGGGGDDRFEILDVKCSRWTTFVRCRARMERGGF